MIPSLGQSSTRTRPDRCPGVVHPWPAADGGLVRIRIPGGRVTLGALRAVAEVADRYGDGRVHVTARANLQLRAMPVTGATLDASALAALESTGLVPSRTHDRVRNVLASPQTGLAGGRADLRPVVAALDDLLVQQSALAALPGRFLFTLDDGRGDLVDRHRDLGLVALDAASAQLRVGDGFGDVVDLRGAAEAIADLARRFLAARGAEPSAAWHVNELRTPLVPAVPPAPGAEVSAERLPYGSVPGGVHRAVGETGLDRSDLADWSTHLPLSATLIVTPWHGVLVPDDTDLTRTVEDNHA